MKRIFTLLAGTILGASFLAGAQPLAPHGPMNFFVTPDRAATLAWDGAPGDASWRLLDFQGKVVNSGSAQVGGGNCKVTLTAPRGYYDLEIAGQKFGLVSQDEFQGSADPFFGMDAVLNWLDRRPEMREAMVRDLKRCGVAMARERINWNQVEPVAGQWNWEEKDQAWALRRIYAKNDLPVLEMFHSPGPARGTFPVKSSYPQDLVLLTKSWPQIYEKFKATWGGLEVWNEPEGAVYGSHLPADQYAVIVKAMRYGFQQKRIAAPLGGGVFMGGDPALFHLFCVLNGLLDNVDFISIHDYKPATKMERLVAVHRTWLKKNGHEGMPLWITESGWAWPKGGQRPGLAADQASALEIAMKAVEAKACGVVRYMPFCLAFYEEGGAKNFAMMGGDVTPLRSMGAYAQSIRVLAGKRYVGDIPVKDPAILRARVFDGKGGRVGVIYTDTVEGNSTVRLPCKVLRAEGIDGRALAIGADGAVPVPDGMAYVWVDNSPLKTDTAAMGLAAEGVTSRGAAVKAGPIVLQYLLDPSQVTYSSTRYMVSEEKAGALPFKVQIHNLADQPTEVKVGLTLPGDRTPSNVQTVKAPPLGVGEAQWTVDLRGRWKTPEVQALMVTGQDGQGQAISPLAVPMLVEGPLESYLPYYPQKTRLEIGNLSKWSPNGSSAGKADFDQSGESGWKFSVKFGPGDRWVYPRFRVEPGTLKGASGFLLRARAQNPADLRMGLSTKNGATFLTADPLVPADGQWHVLFVPLALFEPNQDVVHKDSGELLPEDVTTVSVGMNDRSTDRTNMLEVSDLLVVGPAKNH